MPDLTHLISAELSDADQAEALAAVERLRQLLPFLRTIPEKEKRYLLYPGVRGVEAVTEMARVIEKYAEEFPKSVTDALPELRRDLLLARMLRPVVKALQALTKAAEDTLHAARSDAFRAALVAYAFGKSLGKTVPGMAQEMDALVSYFDRPTRASKPSGDPDA